MPLFDDNLCPEVQVAYLPCMGGSQIQAKQVMISISDFEHVAIIEEEPVRRARVNKKLSIRTKI